MKIAIIGAGFGGMAAAYDLAKKDHKVTLFEAGSQTGGLASGFKEPEWEWSVEKFYHHWFASDKYMLSLIDELGLADNVIFPKPSTVLHHNGKWYPFDSILNAIKFPGLGWGLDKIRFGFVGLYLRVTKNWQQLEKVTAHSWIQRWAGKKVYKQMWEPLLIGKFGPYYQKVNMAWFWARIHARTQMLGTYVGGFQAFSNDFAAILREKNVEIKLSCKVKSIYPESDHKLIVVSEQGNQKFDKVLVTLAPRALSTLVSNIPESYLHGLNQLKSMGAVVMTISLKHKLSREGFYWYNIPDTLGFPFLALVEHTNFLSPQYFGGNHIIYCGAYLEDSHEFFNMSKQELLSRFLPPLEYINPDFKEEWVINSWLHSTKYAQPVPLVNHSKNIPAIKTPISGLYFASMSQVYPWDRGTNFAVEIGRRAVRIMEQS